jgi:hypothetical protein
MNRDSIPSSCNVRFSTSFAQTIHLSHSTSCPIIIGGQIGQDVKLTNHLHTVPKLRMRGAIQSLPHTSSWRGAELIKHMVKFAFTFNGYRNNLD